MGEEQKRELWVSWMGGIMRAPSDSITIGRDPHCEVIIENDSGVSRRHAHLKLLPTAIKLQDLGSRNGTFVEGRRLTGGALLSGGELLRVGNTELRAFPSKSAVRASPKSARPQSQAPSRDVADTTVNTNVFGGLLRDIARATLTNPAEVEVLVAEACDTAYQMASAGVLTASDAAVVADCAVREALRTGDSSWLGLVFRNYSAARFPLPLELARRIVRARGELAQFPEEDLGGYVGMLAGLRPSNPDARRQIGNVFRLLTGEDEH